MRFAYADPPYIGQAKIYRAHPDYAGEVDHAELVARLVRDYPDGWALSCSSPTLREILPLCPDDVRVMAWVKPFASFKPNVNPAYTWEPVIVRSRNLGRDVRTVRDFVSANITLQKGLTGAKPEAFCFWLFEVFGAEPGDALDDLYPGTGAVAAAWLNFASLLCSRCGGDGEVCPCVKAARGCGCGHPVICPDCGGTGHPKARRLRLVANDGCPNPCPEERR